MEVDFSYQPAAASKEKREGGPSTAMQAARLVLMWRYFSSKGMDGLEINRFGIRRPITCSTLSSCTCKSFSLLGTVAGRSRRGASEIAQTAQRQWWRFLIGLKCGMCGASLVCMA